VAWILLYKRCEFGRKICYSSRDIEFSLGDYYFLARPVDYCTCNDSCLQDDSQLQPVGLVKGSAANWSLFYTCQINRVNSHNDFAMTNDDSTINTVLIIIITFKFIIIIKQATPSPCRASRHRTVSRNWPKIESGRPMVTPHLPRKFHANRSSRFLVILLTKKQRYKQRNWSKTMYRGRGN